MNKSFLFVLFLLIILFPLAALPPLDWQEELIMGYQIDLKGPVRLWKKWSKADQSKQDCLKEEFSLAELMEFEFDGKLLSKQTFDNQGKPATSFQYQYNPAGLLIRQKISFANLPNPFLYDYEYKEKTLHACKGQFANASLAGAYQQEEKKDGQLIIKKYYGDKKLARVECYQNNRLIELKTFESPSGSLIHRTVYKYLNSGLLEQSITYEKDGRIWKKTDYFFDNQDKLTEKKEIRYSKYFAPCSYRFIYQYDNWGNIIESKQYKIQGKKEVLIDSCRFEIKYWTENNFAAAQSSLLKETIFSQKAYLFNFF